MRVNIFSELGTREIKAEVKLLTQLFKTIDDTKTLQIILADNAYLHNLNKQYRNIDRPTDVISFPDELDEQSCGDIFISLDKALEQAKEYEHSYERELCFLAVHGYLHVKGYDHETKEDEQVMMDLTEKILKFIGMERKKYDWHQ